MIATIIVDWSILWIVPVFASTVAVFVVPYELLRRALRYPGTREEFQRNARCMLLVPIEILLINLLGGIDLSFILFTPYLSISYVLGLQLVRKGNGWERAWGTVISVFAWALIALYGVLLISFVPEISQGTWALAFGDFMTGLAIVSHWEVRAYQDHRTDAATKDS